VAIHQVLEKVEGVPFKQVIITGACGAPSRHIHLCHKKSPVVPNIIHAVPRYGLLATEVHHVDDDGADVGCIKIHIADADGEELIHGLHQADAPGAWFPISAEISRYFRYIFFIRRCR